MKVLLRADAGENQGTGHVMRCLTLAEALISRGHTVSLMGALGGVSWLTDLIRETGVHHVDCDRDTLNVDHIIGSGFDWVVVDSYQITADAISTLNLSIPCLAIVDGSTRGIIADAYLDQNIGASGENSLELGRGHLMAGSSFALVRDTVVKHRHSSPSTAIAGRARVVAFMGGTDPYGAIVGVAKSIVSQHLDLELELVSPTRWVGSAEAAVSRHPHARVIPPTPELPAILGAADIVVSAAGTSAWDVCTMARPAVLIALVENQRSSLAPIAKAGVALVLDATPGSHEEIANVGQLVNSLVTDSTLRQELVGRCQSTFDGLGKFRVVEAMERMWRA